MPSTALPHSTDNEYTFGADAPASARSKKKKKNKSATIIDTEPKKDAPDVDNVAPADPLAELSKDAPEPVKEDLADPVNQEKTPDQGELGTEETLRASPVVSPPEVTVQADSQPDLLLDDSAPAPNTEALKPPAPAESPANDTPGQTQQPSKPHNKDFVRHDTDRRPLDPAPDRRHPALQMPSPKPSPHMNPVRMQDPPTHHLPQPHARIPDWRYSLSDRPPSFTPAAQLDACPAHINGRPVIKNLVLLGNEGGLDVCRLNRQREIVGRLEGLRGAVLEAKILPRPLCRDDPYQHLRPLVACVVHGPVIDQDVPPTALSSISNYQTTVEVYSLKTSSHIQTLFSSPLIKLESGAALQPPPPDFQIVLAATGRFMTIALGNSGEVLVFDLVGSGQPAKFQCIAKFWTVCKSRIVPSQDSSQASDQKTYQRLPDVPLLSFSGRWLAIVPPLLSSSQKSADGELHSDAPLDPSVTTFVSPPPPQVDCEVDAPADGGILNRVTKQATQEVVKGAQWVGEQGLGMLKSYWRRASQTSSEDASKTTPANHHGSTSPEDAFPPTHGHVTRREPAVKPALVTVIDLLQYAEPRDKVSGLLATFSLPDGCSFLSFDSEGLALFTSNQLGDASSIWDMTRIMEHTTTVKTISRIVRYPRLSPSSVVDVQWTTQGQRIAVLTQKGTLHLHEVPRRDSDSFRRRSSLLLDTHPPLSPTPASPTSPSTNPSWVSNVVSTIQTVQHALHDPEADSLVDSTRKRLGEASLAARHAGGRAVRNGYSSAIGGAQTLRHAQKNKIRLSKTLVARPGCFRWLAGKAEGLIAVIDDQSLASYAVKTNFYNSGRKVSVSLDAGKKVLDVSLVTSIAALPPSLLGRLDPAGPFAACAKAGVHGFWTLGQAAGAGAGKRTVRPSSVVFDKETCPQSMPFHRLRQVEMSTFDGADESVRRALGVGGKDAGSGKESAWVFGGPIPAVTRVNVIMSRSSPDTDPDALDEGAVVDDGFSLRDAGDATDANGAVRK